MNTDIIFKPIVVVRIPFAEGEELPINSMGSAEYSEKSRIKAVYGLGA